MKSGRISKACLLLWLALEAQAKGQTFVLQPTADTSLRSGYPNQNRGGEPLLQFFSGDSRVLLRFHEAAIASAVGSGRLVSASLELYVRSAASNWGTDGRPVEAHRLAADWSEAGATWNCGIDSQPTNSSPNCATQWDGGAFEEDPADTALQTSEPLRWVRFDVTADVAAFLGGTPHRGWLIKRSDEDPGGQADYASREGVAAERPRLILLVETAADDQVPPSLAITAPNRSLLLNEPSPAVVVEYTDGGSGVDTASFRLLVDGQDATASCTAGPQSASCHPLPLPAGTHTLEARLGDNAGNPAQTSFSFRLLLGAGPHVVTLQAAADTYLRKGSPNQNQGAEPILRVQESGDNRALVQFDPQTLLTSLAGATLISATLELHVESNGRNWGQQGRTVDAHRLTAPWVEFAATWSCPSDTNPGNSQPDCGVLWSGGAFAPAATASVLHTNALAGWVSFDVTADVASFLTGTPNHGWLIKKTNEKQSGRMDYDSRQGTAGEGPRLVLVVETAAGGDTIPPNVTMTSPSPGSLLSTASPTISATFSDEGSGIDAASVQLLVDTVDRTSEATVGSNSLVLTPADSLGEGSHTARVAVRDLAGNAASAEVTFTIDTAPPEVTFLLPPAFVQDDLTPEVALAFFDAISGVDQASLRVLLDGAEVTTACSLNGSAASCEPPPLASGAHTLAVQIKDRTGNPASATSGFDLDLDDTAPTVRITAPSQPFIVGDPTPLIRVEYSDPRSGIDPSTVRVELDGMDLASGCSVAAGLATCEAPKLARGSHTVRAEVRDRRGNQAATSFEFVLSLPLEIAFTEPSPDSVLGVPVVRIAGTVSPGVRSVRVNGLEAVVQSGTFAIDNLGLHDGVNNLVAVALDDAGNVGTAAVRITADTTPPGLSVRVPLEGAVLSTPQIAVAGLVNDLTIGTVSETEVEVSVNGTPAAVANRSFLAPGVPLLPGANTVTVVATDRAGNRTTSQVHVTYEPPATPAALRLVSGDEQSAPILTRLPEPQLVRLTDAAGQPRPGASVVFRVIQGSGVLGNGKRSQIATTDAQGEARAEWTLGSRAGLAVDRVRATAAGVVGEAVFTANATAGPPAAIDVVLGDAQTGAVGSPLSLPLVTVLTDGQQNPIAGVAVTFRVAAGGGQLAGAEQAEVPTNDQGLATAVLTLGPTPGLDNNVVEASFAGMGTLPATFRASGFLPGDPAATRIAGVVQDNQGEPVPGVTLRLRNSRLTATTDPHGQFRLQGVPVGQVFLIVDATTSARPGAWASLEYEMVTVAGVENTLPKPIYILPLDLAHGVYVDETHGGTATLPAVPGFSLEIAPGSVTFPGGSRSGGVSVTAVHADKIPMAPGAGMQPRLIVTIQPAGAHFDPPAAITFPNVDSLPPGTVTELFSFDHDLGAFVSVGTGTVSEDGRVVRSDPGFGVLEAGWHCGARTGPNGATATMSIRVSAGRLVLLADQNPAERTILGAMGVPPLDAVYSWKVDDPRIVTLSPSGDGLCRDSLFCNTEATAGMPGETTARAKITCTTTGKTAEEKVRLIVTRMKLKQVSFAGTAYHELLEDGRFSPYSAPHWQDNSDPLDGDAEDKAAAGREGDRRFPVSFTRGSKMRLSVRFVLEPRVTLSGVQVLIRGEGPGDLDVPPTVATIGDGEVEIHNVPTMGTLPYTVEFFNPLRIEWEASINNGADWTGVGTSENRVYVTLRDPIGGGAPYESLFDIACRNAKGLNSEEGVVTAIWSDFFNPIPGVKRKQVDGYNTSDGKQMRYWLEASDPNVVEAGARCQTHEAMLNPVRPNSPLDGVGTCNAWANLLKETLNTQGIGGATIVQVTPKYLSPFPLASGQPGGIMLVKNWSFSGPGSGSGSGAEECALFRYRRDEFTDQLGAPGQGISNPPGGFFNHFIVRYNGLYFDPSYGTGPFASQSEWENASLAGYGIACSRDTTEARKNDLTVDEVLFAP